MPAQDSKTGPKNILVFGDSNAWGWIPRLEIFPTQRLPKANRWPEVMLEKLGSDYDVFCDALPGRTTDLDDPGSELGPEVANGLTALRATVAAHMPLDLVIIALGTNDLKAYFNRTPDQIAEAILGLARAAAGNTGVGTTYSAAKVLILCPPSLGPLHPEDWVREVFSQTSLDASRALSGVLEPMANAEGFAFFDAGSVMQTEGVDGVHFSTENHATLGDAMADVVRQLI